MVWRRAIEFTTTIYDVAGDLPKVERYALADQMRRAVVSIAANIAEGQARQHSKEFVQYLSVAKGSLAELHTLLVVAERLGYIDAKGLKSLERELSEIRRPLSGLISKIRTIS